MKHISITKRAFMLFMTALLLITSTAGRSLAISIKKNAKKPVAEHKKTTKDSKQKAPTVVQAIAFEAVVTPALAYDFTQDFYFLPLPIFFEIPNVSIPKRFEVFYYFFSFFRNVFGHHIAINAP
jgi:hypothetical protein